MKQPSLAPGFATAAALLFAATAGAQTLSYIDFEDEADGSTITSISENGNFWFAFANTAGEYPVGSLLQPDPESYPVGYPGSVLSGDFSPGFGYLEVEGDAFTLPATGWTIECRVRFQGAGGFQTILGRDRDLLEDRTPLADLYFQKNSANHFSCSMVTSIVDNGDGTFTVNRPYAEGTTTAVAGVWYHVAAVYNPTAQTLNLYVDGQLEDSQAAPENITAVTDPFSQFYSVGRGSYGGNAVDGLNGQIDDLRVTGAVLAPEDFLYVAPPPPCYVDLNGDMAVDSTDVLEMVTRVDAGCDLPPRHIYVDADAATNTGPSEAFAGDPLEDGLWGFRAVGTNASIYESSGVASGTEDSPEIHTTITGLTPGQDYDVYVHFWDTLDGGQNWSIRAGFTSGSLELFANGVDGGATTLGATGANYSDIYAYVNPPLLFEADRGLLAGYVGVATADGNGEITVYLDDLPSTNSYVERSWYDGLSYVEHVTAAASYTYVDADSAGNTGPSGAFSGATALEDNLWGERTLGTNGIVYEASGVASGIEDCPEINTTITGLTPGETYGLWVNFWDPGNDANQNWPIRAGLVSGNLTLFASPDGGAAALSATEASFAYEFDYDATQPLFAEGNRSLMAAYVGSAMADGNGEIVVYVDDLPSTNGANQRSWYDGVTYGPPAPSPCNADWNGDVSVDFFDMLDYLIQFDEGCQ
ncbi:MAG: LamG domain-containing protein [Phycisphaeraceae bacterium]|nr:MAG: LamG domain-containing protein [Phycisphaeraceae bacterium]